MGEKTINKIEEKIQNNASIDHGKKAELLKLTAVKPELSLT